MWIQLVILCGFIVPCLTEYCTERYVTYTHAGYGTRTIHCSFGCCGSKYDQYCCVSNAGFIVGLVFAGIFVVSVVTALICCCLKHKASRGRVIQPSVNSNAAVRHIPTQNNVFIVPNAPIAPPAYSNVSQAPNYGYPYTPEGYPPAPGGPLPPAYSQSMPPPPAYSYTNVAYPPLPTTAATPAPPQPSPFAAAAASTSTGQHMK